MGYSNAWPLAVLATAMSCNSGGGGGSVAGLSTPEQVTVVEADDGGASSLRLPSGTAASGLTDYENDRTRFWVHDESMNALGTINSILCALDQTNYDAPAVLNQGPYLALVNCFDSSEGDDSNGLPQYEEWVVDSSRASNSEPHIVKFWVKTRVENQGNDVPGVIYGRAVIRQSPSETQPVGDFTLYFKALTAAQAHDATDTSFEGHLTTVPRTDGQTEFAFFMSHGNVDAPVNNDLAVRERCRVVGNPQAETGRAYTEQKQAGDFGNGLETRGEQFHVQFNATHLVRKRVANTSALRAFDRVNFTTYVYRYGLYDADGARVDRLSGFPLDTTDGKHGWVGFHGMWFPDDVTIANGQTLLRRSFQANQAPTTYTAVVVPGKLEKITRRAITLGDVRGEDFTSFDHVARQEIMVRWTGSDFVKTAVRNGLSLNPIDPPVSIVSSYAQGQFVHMASPHRGGIEFTWPAGSLSDSTPAYARVATVITATSPELAGGDLPLLGYVRRLKAAITQNEANYLSGQEPHFPDASSVNDVKNYVFDKETMLLQLLGTNVTLADGVTVNQGPGMHGFECGPMVTAPLAALTDLQQQTTTYLWRTGANPWNQLRTVKDAANNVVNFDPPLVFEYVHQEPGSAFHGRRMFLEWDGSHLSGIVYRQGDDDRHYPEFNIQSGTTLTLNGATYRLKQLEGEQVMNEISDVNGVITSQGFDLTNNLLTPPASEYVDPAIGALPALEQAPRFVGGVAQ